MDPDKLAYVQRKLQGTKCISDQHRTAASVNSHAIVLRLDPDDVVVRDHECATAVTYDELTRLGCHRRDRPLAQTRACPSQDVGKPFV